MDTLSNYIPIDVRHALANGQSLPEYLQGAALFADIAGFMNLTEALAQELGAQRGAEELTAHLNHVYNALIAELHRYGGSVIGFSGDAITCWLDGDDGRRATAAALAMQASMGAFANVQTASGKAVSLALKTAVVTGPVRRFTVGDPHYCLLNTMTGRTMEKLAAAEHQAVQGDVILDEETAVHLQDALTIMEWRADAAGGQRFAVVVALALDVPESPWPALPEDALSTETKSSWLLPQVYERLRSGRGEFLAEIRSAYSFFLRFTGIDYDEDPDAPAKLDAFIQQAQHILMRLDGSMLALTIGDKGSYLQAVFGAPVAHEDDAVRVANAALEMQALAGTLPYLQPVKIGITRGHMRTGAYGSDSRRTYGVQGDDVNLAARLMTAAQPGQILVTSRVREAAGDRFVWESLPAIMVKGKSEPITIFELSGEVQGRLVGWQEPKYQLPMVGREDELTLLSEKLKAVSHSKGQVVGISGDAGLGKSRLTAELIAEAGRRDFVLLGSECESYGTATSYQVWRGIWRQFFDLDSAQSLEEQIAALTSRLGELDPALLPRLPLLGAVTNLIIPDNDLTQSLDAKVRKSSLEEMLVRCLQARCQTRPLLLVLENCHWLDDLSRDLIDIVGQNAGDLPLFLLLVYRPLDQLPEQALTVRQLDHFTEIELSEFSLAETKQLLEIKLAQIFAEKVAVPPDLLQRVAAHAAGNPFYIEELLNYLHGLGLDIRETAALEQIDLPNSITALVLSRIDQLNESQQMTIKVASVIGRLFRAQLLWGIYPELVPDVVRQNLKMLSDLELTTLDVSEPELSYLFKHIITQQVAYSSLLYATRASLHEQIGQYVERRYANDLPLYYDLLAFHFEHSENEAKKREYFIKAGIAAQADSANHTAITYFTKALPLVSGADQVDVLLKLGKAQELTGDWQSAGETYELAVSQAADLAGRDLLAWGQTALGELWRKRNEYDTADNFFVQAQENFSALNNEDGIRQVHHHKGTLAANRGDYALANQHYSASLVLAQKLGDQKNEASVLNNLGLVARYLGDRQSERRYYEQSLAISEAIGNRWLVAVLRNNLGNMAIDTGDTTYARQQLEQALVIWREIGERWATTNTLHNLANVARDEGSPKEALQLYAESVGGWQSLNDNWGLAYWLEDMGLFYLTQSAPQKGITLISAAAALREQIGAPRPPAYQERLDNKLAPARMQLGEEEQNSAFKRGQDLDVDQGIEMALDLAA